MHVGCCFFRSARLRALEYLKGEERQRTRHEIPNLQHPAPHPSRRASHVRLRQSRGRFARGRRAEHLESRNTMDFVAARLRKSRRAVFVKEIAPPQSHGEPDASFPFRERILFGKEATSRCEDWSSDLRDAEYSKHGKSWMIGPVAQLAEAHARGACRCGFDSHPAHHGLVLHDFRRRPSGADGQAGA